MEPTKSASHKKLGMVIGGAAVLLVALIAVFAGKKPAAPAAPADTAPADGTDVATQNPSTATTTVVAGSSATAATSPYKDGTYTATGSYISPGGPDKIGVTLTLADGIVTEASVTPEPGDGQSSRYQAKFASGYKALVVGQNISTLHLTRVSGSSLTPIGFDDALSQIKAQAQA